MRRRACNVCLLFVVLAGPWGCGEDHAPAPVVDDAGTSCLRGTQGCLCTLSADGCESGLLCIANRCFPLEGENTGGARSVPPGAGGAAIGGAGGAGGASAGGRGNGGGGNSSDASVPDAAAGNVGATDAAANPPDASPLDASSTDASL